MVLTLFAVFAALLALGAPLAAALGVASLAACALLGQDAATTVYMAWSSMTVQSVMALPAFMLAGALMEQAGMARRLACLAESVVGPTPGGLAVSAALACVFFGAVCGSGPATTAAVGMMLIPAMLERGYTRGYAAATTATAGGVGIAVPPGIPLVVYGVATQESISRLFLAGVVPGLLLSVSLVLAHLYLCRHMPPRAAQSPRPSRVFRQSLLSLLAPVFILCGIYGGFCTPIEAAAGAIVYTLLVGFVLHRELTFSGVLRAMQATSWMAGRVLLVLFCATLFSRFLMQYRLVEPLVAFMHDRVTSVFAVWALVTPLLLLLGMIMETLSLILLATPVLLPLMTSYGVDPTHFGIVLIICCGVGFSMPPLGENLIIASGIAKTSLERVSAQTLPLCGVAVGVALVVAFFPSLTLWLPQILLY